MTTRKHHHLPKAVEKKSLKQFEKSKKKKTKYCLIYAHTLLFTYSKNIVS